MDVESKLLYWVEACNINNICNKITLNLLRSHFASFCFGDKTNQFNYSVMQKCWKKILTKKKEFWFFFVNFLIKSTFCSRRTFHEILLTDTSNSLISLFLICFKICNSRHYLFAIIGTVQITIIASSDHACSSWGFFSFFGILINFIFSYLFTIMLSYETDSHFCERNICFH